MTPKEMLAEAAPKCGNCKYMKQAFQPEPRTPIPGKGICLEPALAIAGAVFYVTDLGLCSEWQSKG